jgi:nucleotide-binding universal stress UspA family protein
MNAYRTLLVDVGLDGKVGARIVLAAALARRLGALLVGLAAVRFRPLATRPFGTLDAGCEAEQRRIQTMLCCAANRFGAHARSAGEAAECRTIVGDPAEAMAQAAGSADLLVVGQASASALVGGDQGAHPGDILMRAGRPTLIVPPGVAALDARRVPVAWKDRREARRAIADAMPLPAQAERVVLLGLYDEGGSEAATRGCLQDVARHLERHGAGASVEVVPRRDRDAADLLFDAAARLGADLIVAGGRGHPRTTDWLFGGVTYDMMTRSPSCCLVSN